MGRAFILLSIRVPEMPPFGRSRGAAKRRRALRENPTHPHLHPHPSPPPRISKFLLFYDTLIDYPLEKSLKGWGRWGRWGKLLRFVEKKILKILKKKKSSGGDGGLGAPPPPSPPRGGGAEEPRSGDEPPLPPIRHSNLPEAFLQNRPGRYSILYQ